MDAWTIIIVAVLVVLSGLFSGLTLGLMSLKPAALARKAKLGNAYAQQILPLRKNGNLLLTTLLLGNVLVNTVLSIYLGSITAGVLAALIATSLIVVFGEIIPQALINKHALHIGAKTRYLTRFFLLILYPVAKPISLALDKTLGHELPTIMTKKEIGMIVEEQTKIPTNDLGVEEASIVNKGLQLSEKRVRDVMTPTKQAYYLHANDLLTKKLLKQIEEEGYSRIPVYDDEDRGIIGLIYAKDLIATNYHHKEHVSDYLRQPVEVVNEKDKLDKVLRLFKKKRVHLFIVHNEEHNPTGIITLEDVLEEIFGEIEDEYDETTN